MGIYNSDLIWQTNKGVIGVRLDQIQETKIKDLTIDNLYNFSASMLVVIIR